MCMIELFEIIHPDGTREQRERLVNCPQGTPNRPCRNTQRINTFQERPAVPGEIRAREIREAATPYYREITPAGSERPQPRRRDKNKPKGLFSSIISAFMGTSLRSKKPETKKVFVKNRRKLPLRETRPATDYHPPQAPTPPQWYPPPVPTPPQYHPPHMADPAAMPNEPISPEIIPIEPRPDNHRHEQNRHSREANREARPRKRATQRVKVHNPRGEGDSPSPPKAVRNHQRKSRSLSPVSRYQAKKQAAWKRERHQHEERIARQQEARDRAVQLERDERRAREREEEQRRIEFEERRRIESAERVRRRQDQEARERHQVRDWGRDQARAHQEREDAERLRADRARRPRGENDRWAEQQRLDRLRRAGIPRQPRQEPAVRCGENMQDRGERFIREAVAIERERRDRPMAYDRYGGEFLRRRNTVDGVPRRRRYEDERPWHSR
ncbi:hypothetical protein N7G274_001172 [Stereocaulon virgatum]|uniref:Uncharacterized protein n=1 Tax=Stereocaulon virgatum TaxID=373712 RepID=A0ABR4AUK9_9LECA